MSLYEVLTFARGENMPVVGSMEPISDALVESNLEIGRRGIGTMGNGSKLSSTGLGSGEGESVTEVMGNAPNLRR